MRTIGLSCIALSSTVVRKKSRREIADVIHHFPRSLLPFALSLSKRSFFLGPEDEAAERFDKLNASEIRKEKKKIQPG
jgi:hypothetical protein